MSRLQASYLVQLWLRSRNKTTPFADIGPKTYSAIQPCQVQRPTCLCIPATTQEPSWYEQRSPHTKAHDQCLIERPIGSTATHVSLKENIGQDMDLNLAEGRYRLEKWAVGRWQELVVSRQTIFGT